MRQYYTTIGGKNTNKKLKIETLQRTTHM